MKTRAGGRSPAADRVISKMLWMAPSPPSRGCGLLTGVDHSGLRLGDHCGTAARPAPRRREPPGDLLRITGLSARARTGSGAARRHARNCGPAAHDALRGHVPDQKEPSVHEKGEPLADPGGRRGRRRVANDREIATLPISFPRKSVAISRLARRIGRSLGPAVPPLQLQRSTRRRRTAQSPSRKKRGGEEQDGETASTASAGTPLRCRE